MAWSDEDTDVELAARHQEAVQLLAEVVADRRELVKQLEQLRARVAELESASPADASKHQGRGRLFGVFRRGS